MALVGQTCRACGGRRLVFAGQVDGFALLACRDCDLVFAPAVTAGPPPQIPRQRRPPRAQA